MKPQITADNENESDAAESEAREVDMETNDVEEMTAERLRSTYHSSDMALALERLVRLELFVDTLHRILKWFFKIMKVPRL